MKGNLINNNDFLKFIFMLGEAIAVTPAGHQQM
jgi:hypothetical protein